MTFRLSTIGRLKLIMKGQIACFACTTKITKIDSDGFERWFYNTHDQWLCYYCNCRYAKTSKGYIVSLHAALIELLGGKCVICGENDRRVLQADHIKGGGLVETNSFKSRTQGVYLKYLNDPELAKQTLQCLCANHHMIKKYENHEQVPKRNRHLCL